MSQFRILGVTIPTPGERVNPPYALLNFQYGVLLITGAALHTGSDGLLRVALPRSASHRIVITDRAERDELTRLCIEAVRPFLGPEFPPATPAADTPVARALPNMETLA